MSGSVAFTEAESEQIALNLSTSLKDGVVTVIVDDQRSQWRNRQIARERLKGKLDEALRPAPPPRRATRPSRRARQRRVDEKKRRSETKRLRGRPEIE